MLPLLPLAQHDRLPPDRLARPRHDQAYLALVQAQLPSQQELALPRRPRRCSRRRHRLRLELRVRDRLRLQLEQVLANKSLRAPLAHPQSGLKPQPRRLPSSSSKRSKAICPPPA